MFFHQLGGAAVAAAMRGRAHTTYKRTTLFTALCITFCVTSIFLVLLRIVLRGLSTPNPSLIYGCLDSTMARLAKGPPLTELAVTGQSESSRSWTEKLNGGGVEGQSS